MRQRPDRAAIQLEWIERVVAHPFREQIQRDGQIAAGHRSPRWTAATYELYFFLAARPFATRFLTAHCAHEDSLLPGH